MMLVNTFKVRLIHLDCTKSTFGEKNLSSGTFSIECLRQIFCDFGDIGFATANCQKYNFVTKRVIIFDLDINRRDIRRKNSGIQVGKIVSTVGD